MSKIRALMTNFWSHLKLRFSSDADQKKLMIYRLLVQTGQVILAGMACTFTLAGLTVAFGPMGVLLGTVGTLVVSWLYNAYVAGEEHGIRWFTTSLLAYVSLPYFAVASGYSLLITLIFTAGLVWAFDVLRTMHNVLGVRLSRLQAA